MEFKPFVKENILREIRQRVKKPITFLSGLAKAVTIIPKEDDPYWVRQEKLKLLVAGKEAETK